jgi:hypothetical protein
MYDNGEIALTDTVRRPLCVYGNQALVLDRISTTDNALVSLEGDMVNQSQQGVIMNSVNWTSS